MQTVTVRNGRIAEVRPFSWDTASIAATRADRRKARTRYRESTGQTR
ncbi:hypothetical protein [Streptomyces albipurpureus]|nr:hypothetical protein [Streptomyces sp. CWNU-1]